MNEAKRRILRKGAELIHKKGFCSTSINNIVKAAGIPKGSFYFYFKSKEDFGIHLIEMHSAIFQNKLESFIKRKDLGQIEKLRLFFRSFADYYEDLEYEGGSPIGNLIEEMSDLSLNFRERLLDNISEIEKKISEILIQAVSTGELNKQINSEELASFIYSSWEGAVMMMKLKKTSAPIKRFDYYVFDIILK